MRRGLFLALAVLVSGIAWTRREAPAVDPSWSTVQLSVPELDCAFWCGVKLATALESIDGVQGDAFDAKRGRFELHYDPARQSPARVMASLRERGLRVEALDPRGASDR